MESISFSEDIKTSAAPDASACRLYPAHSSGVRRSEINLHRPPKWISISYPEQRSCHPPELLHLLAVKVGWCSGVRLFHKNFSHNSTLCCSASRGFHVSQCGSFKGVQWMLCQSLLQWHLAKRWGQHGFFKHFPRRGWHSSDSSIQRWLKSS